MHVVTGSRRRQLFAGVLFVLFVTAGVMAGIAGSSSGRTLPPAKQAVFDASASPAANAPPPAPKDPSAIPAAAAPTPPPDAGVIELASQTGGFQVPTASETFTPTSAWSDVRGDTLLEVFGGMNGQGTSTGAIFVAATDNGTGLQGSPSGLYVAPSGTGPITLTAVNGNIVSFNTSSGGSGSFNLATQTFTIG
jgi:hypothetical protein